MTSRFEEARQQEVYTARLQEQTDALKRWLEKNHPEIPLGMALLKEFQENMLGAFFTASDADWEFALNMIDTRYLRQHVATPQEKRGEIIEEILSLLSAHSRRDESMLKSEESRMKHMSLDALEARLAELKYKIGAVGTPVSILKAFVAASRPQPRVKVLPAEYTRERIHAMPSHEIKKLIRDYTASVVNDRLFGLN